MTAKSTYISIDEFTQKTSLKSHDSECIWQGISFRKGDSLEDSRIKEILDICRKYHNFNINTLIVKDKNQLTIWIEERSHKDRTNIPNTKQQSPQERELDLQKLPTKTVVKKYRGQVYEETVVDWSAVNQTNFQKKARRKYRGQYID